MPATVEVRALHGAAPGLGVDVSNTTIRFKRADDDFQDDNAPVPIPAVGIELSWRKSLLAVATVLPDNSLSNLRFLSLGESLGVGRDVFFARTGSYVQASAADQAGLIGTTNVDSLTPTTPEVIQPGTFITSSDAAPTSGGALQDIVMLQLRHDPTALAGDAAAAKTLIYRYDER